MSLVQFWRILWAWRLLILGTTFSCLLGGVFVILAAPPRWTAEANVYINLLKPDPVTGLIVGQDLRSYVATQINLITDYTVVGTAVDKLGWQSNPNFIRQYQKRSDNDTRDFRHWLAAIIIARAKAQLNDGSNILDITYTSSTPESAKQAVDALRQAYIETSLTFRRTEAIKNATWFALQAQKAKISLDAAEAAVTKYERNNGIVLTQDGKADVDTVRLTSMASQGAVGAAAGGSTGIDYQLAEMDAAIATASSTMGPNNPEMQAMRAKRAAIAALVARDRTVANIKSTGTGASFIDTQKALVISQRDKLGPLKALQTEADIKRDLYNKTSQKEMDFRQEAAVTDAGLTPLGSATVPPSPSFPKIPLIIGGCFGLGLLMGMLLALLIELLNRRVRGTEDLLSLLDLPVLAVVEAPR